MNKNFGLLLCLVFALSPLLNGCAKPSDAAATGEAYFRGYGCATCHRIGSQGGTLGPDLTTIGFRKTPEWLDLWLKEPEAWNAHTVMPNFYLKENVRIALVAYLSSLKGEAFKFQVKPWDAADLADDPKKRGKVLFEHVGCIGCHGVEGKGGMPNNNVVGGKIPSLTYVADGYSHEEMEERIAKGKVSDPADPAQPAPMIRMPAWGELLSKEEIEAIAEYLI